MPPFVVALLPIVHDLLPIVLPLVLGWLGTVHFKNAKVDAALQSAKDAAGNVAKAVAQPYVDELLKDSADGVITPEEQAAADRHAVSHMIELIPGTYAAILRSIFPGETLATYLLGLLKGATHDLTLARLQAPSDPPAPFNVVAMQPGFSSGPKSAGAAGGVAAVAAPVKIDPVSGRAE